MGHNSLGRAQRLSASQVSARQCLIPVQLCLAVLNAFGDMDQISKRVVNVGQKRRALIRVVTLEGTIDEIIQEILLRLWAPLREVLR